MVQTRFLNAKTRQGAFSFDPEHVKPHIFMITVDMISPDCYLPSRALSQYINMANINEIANAGTRFNRAFTPSSLCGPARAALFTGTHPPYLTNGERALCGMQVDLTTNDIIFQDYLKAIGYQLKHAGKCHVGVDKFIKTFGENMHGWDRWGPPGIDDDRYLDYLDGLNVLPPAYKKEIWGKLSDRTTNGNSFGGWIMQQNGDDFPIDAHYSVFLAQLAIKQVKAAFRQQPDKPLFSQLNFFDPHQPYSIPAGLEKRYQKLLQKIEMPSSFKRLLDNDFKLENTDHREPINAMHRLYQKYWGIYDEVTLKSYIAAHLLQVEVVDYAVGQFIAQLKMMNIWQQSLIIFTADHGDMNGRLAMADKGVYLQPDIFRVPLFIKKPNEQKGGQSEALVSLLDIAPTILNSAGITPPEAMEGRMMDQVIDGSAKPLIQIYQGGLHVGENLGFGFQIQREGRHWFYGYNSATGLQELYDIDLDDQINRFYFEEHDQLRREIINEAATMISTDPRWFGYWACFRLHNMAWLPKPDGDDMQMLKPKA